MGVRGVNMYISDAQGTPRDNPGYASGAPRAYQTGASSGHALAASKTTDGEPVVLDYAIEWRAETGTLDGTKGAFHVTGVTVHQRGDGPERSTFTRSGDRWTRTPAP